MSRIVTAKLRIELPMIPSVLFLEGGQPNKAIPIDSVSDEELQAIGEEWTRVLIELAQNKRMGWK